jgi:hypothetical protein
MRESRLEAVVLTQAEIMVALASLVVFVRNGQ